MPTSKAGEKRPGDEVEKSLWYIFLLSFFFYLIKLDPLILFRSLASISIILITRFARKLPGCVHQFCMPRGVREDTTATLQPTGAQVSARPQETSCRLKSLGTRGSRRGWTWRMEGPSWIWSFLEVVFLLSAKSTLSLFSSRFSGMQGYCFNTMNSSVSSSVKITPLQQMISSCSGALITSFLGKLFRHFA